MISSHLVLQFADLFYDILAFGDLSLNMIIPGIFWCLKGVVLPVELVNDAGEDDRPSFNDCFVSRSAFIGSQTSLDVVDLREPCKAKSVNGSTLSG